MTAWRVRVSDGTELCALRYLVDSGERPGPTLFSLDPYRNQSWQRSLNDDVAKWAAGAGCHFVVVDARGTGSSGGVAVDEYTDLELQDAFDVLETICSAPWSNGQILLYGFSYSGFVSLHLCSECHRLRNGSIAAALVFVASDDRLETDVHWWGGVKTVTDWTWYAAAMTAFNLLPPDEQQDGRQDVRTLVGRRYRPWNVNWLDKGDGRYWRTGSARFGRRRPITVPLLLYAGFHDLYTTAMLRVHQTAPNNILLVGQEGHAFPPNSALLFGWWLRAGPNWRGARMYCQPRSASPWLELAWCPHRVAVFQWAGGPEASGLIPNRIVCGPLLRYNLAGLRDDLVHQLDRAGLRLPVPAAGPFTWAGAPHVEIELADDATPDRFYLVAWLLSVNSLDNKHEIWSMGVAQRPSTFLGMMMSSRMTIPMSPVVVPPLPGREFRLYLTTSNLPNLLPQLWLRAGAIPVRSGRLTMPLATVRQAMPRSDMFPVLPAHQTPPDIQLLPTIERLVFRPEAGEFELITHQNDYPATTTTIRDCNDERLHLRVTPRWFSARFFNLSRTGQFRAETTTELSAHVDRCPPHTARFSVHGRVTRPPQVVALPIITRTFQL